MQVELRESCQDKQKIMTGTVKIKCVVRILQVVPTFENKNLCGSVDVDALYWRGHLKALSKFS